METFIENNNSYHLFRIDKKENSVSIYLIWGKTDFFWEAEKFSEGRWKKKKLSIFKNEMWYQYSKVTEHGEALEEILWENAHDTLYIELPKHFQKTIDTICTQILQKKHSDKVSLE